MTRVRVHPGNCGFSVTVTVRKGEDKKIDVSMDTECEMVREMLDEISQLDMRSLFTNHIDNPLYRSAAKHLKHAACPVPSAILKAAEVELGLCLAEDVTITFENLNGDKEP